MDLNNSSIKETIRQQERKVPSRKPTVCHSPAMTAIPVVRSSKLA